MSGAAGPLRLEHVLAGRRTGQPDLERMKSDDLKPAARFWLGTAANKMRLGQYSRALADLLRDKTRLGVGLKTLPDNEKTVLGICRRYGGFVSGSLLLHEVQARGLIKRLEPGQYGAPRVLKQADPVYGLCAKVLLYSPESSYQRYDFFYHWGNTLKYPDLALLPQVAGLIEPFDPFAWKASAGMLAPESACRRAPAEVALDLASMVQALAQGQPWRTNRDGSLPKNVASRLAKLVAGGDQDPQTPPAVAILYYELLRALGCIEQGHEQARIDLPLLEHHLSSPAAAQSWDWVRAWLRITRWQDGIGAKQEKPYSSSQEKGPLREFLAWALCGVAHGSDDWLDLETFLDDLWAIHREHSLAAHESGYSWSPAFKSVAGDARDALAGRRDRWRQHTGIWIANALLGTLAHLGLIEQSRTTKDGQARHGFRLTDTGKSVFGAPEAGWTKAPRDPKFLTVQPNHEVVALVDSAEPAWVWPLARMARRASPAGNRAHTFTLSRDSVYHALETGFPLERIEEFFRVHSRSGLPDNVAKSLREWGGKHEALVIRTDLALRIVPEGVEKLTTRPNSGRAVGDCFLLLPQESAAAAGKGCVRRDHQRKPAASWRITEDGLVQHTPDTDAVSLAHLRQFSEREADGWRVTAASILRARERSLGTENVLHWLSIYLNQELPALVEIMIRNWTKPPLVGLGSRLVLQMPDAESARALHDSQRFRPYLLEYIPPTWFHVRPEKQRELRKLLQELGFLVGAQTNLSPKE
jgi:hypothetical protein